MSESDPGDRGLPVDGRSRAHVLEELRRRKQADRDWRDGRVFGLIYHGGNDVESIRTTAHERYSADNAVAPGVSPSLVDLETEVVAMTAGLLGGDGGTVGHVTTGGTESNLLAVKAARDFARATRPTIETPAVVFPETAHPTIAKAAHLFGLEAVSVAVDDGWRADVDAMRAAITDETVLLVGSAPSITIGVIDPIEAIGHLAAENDLPCHVDSCIGGFVLPFLRDLGHDIPPFDLSVPGVTSIAADQHKFGYGHKGASTILYADDEFRKHQYFVYDEYPGGLYTTPNLTGSKSGGPIAAAWAVMQYLGRAGYRDLVERTMTATEAYQAGVVSIDGLEIIGDPDATMFAFTATTDAINRYALYDELTQRGWTVSPMRNWDIHLTITDTEVDVVDDFLADLEAAVATARDDDREPGSSVRVGYGGDADREAPVDEIAREAMSELYR